MRVTCPGCAQAVDIPDSEAGRTVGCPRCGEAFQAPVLWDVPVSFSPPPPPLPPPPPPPPAPGESVTRPAGPEAGPNPAPPPTTTPDAPAKPATPTAPRQLSLRLRLDVIEKVAPACLALTFLLTFAAWAGIYPAGYAAYTQSPWQAVFATFSVGPVSGTPVEELEVALNDTIRSDWLLMIPYLLTLLAALVVAGASFVVPRLRQPLPEWLRTALPFRMIALSALTGVSFLLLLIQTTAGFGRERATAEVVAARLDQPDPRTQQERQIYEMRQDSEVARHRLRQTGWLWTAGTLHFVAMAAVGLELWLRRRDDREEPSLVVRW